MQEVKLYHGSRRGIEGKLQIIVSRDAASGRQVLHDFGNGFYMGTKKSGAIEWVASSANTATVLTTTLDMDCLNDMFNVYSFGDSRTDNIEWALFVGYNRRKLFTSSDDREKYPYCMNHFNSIAQADIIVGDISDDLMMASFTEFANNEMDIATLYDCLKSARLGTQFLFKSQSAFDYLNAMLESGKIAQLPYMNFLKTDPEYHNTSVKEILETLGDKEIERANTVGKIKAQHFHDTDKMNSRETLDYFETYLYRELNKRRSGKWGGDELC